MPKIMLLKKMKQRAPPLDTMVTAEREKGDRRPRPGGEGPLQRGRGRGQRAAEIRVAVRWENREASSGMEGAVGGSGSGSYLAGRTVSSTCWRLLRRARSDQGSSTVAGFPLLPAVAMSGRASVSRQCRGTGTSDTAAASSSCDSFAGKARWRRGKEVRGMRSDQEQGGRVAAVDSGFGTADCPRVQKKVTPTARVVRRAMGLRFASWPRICRAYWFGRY